jgi:hypothetical protein
MGAFLANKIFFSFEDDNEIIDSKIAEILSQNTDRIQVDCYRQKLTSNGWKRLNDNIFKQKPEIGLRLYKGENIDLSFLQYMPNVENLQIEAHEVENVEYLTTLKHLKVLVFYVRNQNNFFFFDKLKSPIEKLYLGTDENKSAKWDISPITNFEHLKFLQIERYNKGLSEIIPNFKQLEELSLHSVAKLDSIDFIAEQKTLTKVRLNSCDIDNYEPLAKMTQLKSLSLYKPAKLQTLDTISQMLGLQFIFLQTVNNPITFPNIERLTKLRRVVMYAMKSIRDFRTLENTSSLKEFCFYETQTQQPEDFIPVFTNKHIEKINIWSLKSGYRTQLENLMAQYGRQREYINFLSDADFEYE